MKINRTTIGLLAAVAAWGLGCAGYQAGPTGGRTAGARSVQVKFFENETFEPRIATAVDRKLKHEFQKDGTYTLETQAEGDLIVTGKLVSFRRNGVSYKPGDVLTVQDYTMELSAEITVINSATGEEIFHETLTGTSTIRGQRPHRRPTTGHLHHCHQTRRASRTAHCGRRLAGTRRGNGSPARSALTFPSPFPFRKRLPAHRP